MPSAVSLGDHVAFLGWVSLRPPPTLPPSLPPSLLPSLPLFPLSTSPLTPGGEGGWEGGWEGGEGGWRSAPTADPYQKMVTREALSASC